MKKLSAMFTVFIIVFAAGIYAHAASFSITSTELADGEAYTPYEYQIATDIPNNEGLTFEEVDNSLPTGLSLDSDTGVISGTPQNSGRYKRVEIRITSGETSEVYRFSVYIKQRPVNVHITVPENIVYDGNGHTAEVECTDVNGEPIPAVSPIVTYGTEELEAAVEAGSYHVNVFINGCSISSITGDTILTIHPAPVSLSITAEDRTFPYDGSPHGLDKSDITVTPEISYEIEYRKQGTDEYVSAEPVTAGVYDARIYTTDPNYIDAEEHATITITAEAVDFTLTGEDDGDINYGEEWHGTYTPSKDLSKPATVKYVKDGVEYDTPQAAGTYTVRITLSPEDSEKYQVGTITPPTVTVHGVTVNFTVTGNEAEYDGTNKGDDVTVSPQPNLAAEKYTVSFQDAEGKTVENPTNAGTYTIHITISDDGYSVGTITPNTLVIDPKPVTFTITNNTVPYDGGAHKATVTSNDGLSDSDYTVQYRSTSGALTNDVTAAGEYDIVITFPSGNYTLAEDISAKMTITSVASLNIGNSPAAMIYNEAAADKDDAVNNFKTSRIYNDTRYPKFTVPNTSDTDFDADINTVIVDDIKNFNDPGMVVNGAAAVNGSDPVEVSDGLYKVTYTYDGGTLTRYVMVVGGKIGDANGDGYVNAIDGNYITANASDGKPTTVTQARIWDVNKDGTLNRSDADAIYNRFSAPLKPYYPWVK